MITQLKTMLIGLFVMVACGIVIGIILFIEPSIGDGKQVLNIRFSNINGLSVGTRVAFAGRPVGEVVSIDTIPNARNQPHDELGNIYYYQLVAHIDSHIKVYTTDEIATQTSGLLGEKSIAIIPKPLPKGMQAKLATAATPFYANSVDPIESAFHQLSALSEKVEDAVEVIVKWVDENGAALGDAVRSFDKAMSAFGDTMITINEENVIGDIKAAVQSFTSTSDSIQNVICQMEQAGVFENFGITMDHVKNASMSMDHILGNLEEGKGTIGRLLSDDDFYLRLMSILTKVDTTMNDINHYGILFNLNKEWQRCRQKRASILNALETPNQFKDYFESEIDSINTAMARIAVLIEKAEQTPEKQRILESDLFRKDFADLLRKVNELLDNLKLYNEELESNNSRGCGNG